MTVCDSRGRVVPLGATLGQGGEGRVFEVSGHRDLVAKLYHQAVEPEKAAKLESMVRLRTERLLRLAAWPVETLHERQHGEVAGLLMPRVHGFREIHTLYSPKSRLAAFSHAGWPFLIHTAANVARAFAVIHEHGHVVGDVNHGNLVVSDQAMVALIDCDSFQVTTRGRRFPCDVGVSTHTPPELQGRVLRGVVRTANHDAFGLAVLVFQLLFMGRHPFSGGYLGSGEMALEKAIQEFRFAYGPRAGARQMKPPPGTLPLEAVSQPVAALFERAFAPRGARAGGRPAPREWVAALTTLGNGLQECAQKPGHHYYCALPACPWCEIESRAGTTLFKMASAVPRPAQRPFALEALWAQITAVPSPGPPPTLPRKSDLIAQPSSQALAVRREQRKRRAAALGVVASAAAACIALPMSLSAAVSALVVALLLGAGILRTGPRGGSREARAALRKARSRWQALEERWWSEAGGATFDAKRRELAAFREQYRGLASARPAARTDPATHRRERQLRRYLDQYRIDQADIAGLGPGRKVTLQSYGMETAADLSQAALATVPGFGPSLISKLVDWRGSLERGFAFDPTQPLEVADLAALEHDIAAQRAKLEAALRHGPAQLYQMRDQILARRQSLLPTVTAALKALAQAEADAGVLW
jgi:DNA-binding helix-hairpin-helix protein with protein kinase domain